MELIQYSPSVTPAAAVAVQLCLMQVSRQLRDCGCGWCAHSYIRIQQKTNIQTGICTMYMLQCRVVRICIYIHYAHTASQCAGGIYIQHIAAIVASPRQLFLIINFYVGIRGIQVYTRSQGLLKIHTLAIFNCHQGKSKLIPFYICIYADVYIQCKRESRIFTQRREAKPSGKYSGHFFSSLRARHTNRSNKMNINDNKE